MASSGSTSMYVKESETGLVRLFAIDLPPNEALALRDQPSVLAGLLGVSEIEAPHWELFDLTDLAGLGLEGYLAEGHGIAEDQLAPHRWALDALEGGVFILRSTALPNKPTTLTPKAPLRWVATFGEVSAPVPLRANLPSESAQGSLSPAASTSNGPRGTLIMFILGALMAAVLALALYLIVFSG